MFDASPDGWEPTTLGAVAILGGGTTPAKSEDGYWSDGSIPWATPSDITSLPNGKVRISATEFAVTDRALKECSLTLNKPGTVLMTSRATIGYAALNDVPMATNQGFITFRCGERIDPEFLLHWLIAKREFLVAAAGGSTFKELSRGTAKLLPMLLPLRDEQRRIAHVLNSIDDAISTNSDALQQVERSRSAILHAAFEEMDWESVPLGELGKWQSGSTPSKGVAGNWGGGVPWICPRDMKVPVIAKTSETISNVALGGSCRLAPAGTLMLVVRGMILARAIPTAITAVEAAYNQDMKAFVPSGRVSARFVQMCIQHQEARLLRKVNTATHGTKKLDTETIESISIPLPDIDSQNTLVATVSRLDEATVY